MIVPARPDRLPPVPAPVAMLFANVLLMAVNEAELPLRNPPPSPGPTLLPVTVLLIIRIDDAGF